MDINIAHARMAHANEEVLRKTLMQANIKPTGNLLSCGPCKLHKAKMKAIPKSASSALHSGERLHMDLSGPYHGTITKDVYWVKFKDQFSKMNWNIFCKAKSSVPSILEQKLKQFAALNIRIRYLRCDNAGEHGDRVRLICEK